MDGPIDDAIDARRAALRDQGDALTQGRQAQNRRMASQLRSHPGRPAKTSNTPRNQGFEIPPPFGRQQQLALDDFSPAHTVLRGQGVIHRQGRQQMLSPSPMDVETLADGLAGNKGDIQSAARQGVEVLASVPFDHFEGYVGSSSEKPVKQVIEGAGPQRRQDADAQGLLVGSGQVGDLIDRPVELDHRSVRAFDEVASRRRQQHTGRAALEDPRAQPVFQFLDAARDGRLLDAQAARGAPKPAAFGRRQDVAHLVETKTGPGRRLTGRRVEDKGADGGSSHGDAAPRRGHRRPPPHARPPGCASPLYTSNIAAISADLVDAGGTRLETHGDPPYIFGEPEDMAMAIAASPAAALREPKKERIELRVAASAKDLIQRAMAVSGLTAGDLAYEGARRVLDEHERMVLTGADARAFLDALIDPPAPNDKLVAAARRYKARMG